MSFPKHLIDGYRTFTSQRLPTEQTRYRELSERGQSPAVGCGVAVAGAAAAPRRLRSQATRSSKRV